MNDKRRGRYIHMDKKCMTDNLHALVSRSVTVLWDSNPVNEKTNDPRIALRGILECNPDNNDFRIYNENGYAYFSSSDVVMAAAIHEGDINEIVIMIGKE